MRYRPRLPLIVAPSVALARGCSVNVEGGDYSDPEVEPRREPRAEARAYCALVEEFYERLGAFQDRAFETDAAKQAEDRTVEYEERECGIVVR
jgi:hypothetical protein